MKIRDISTAVLFAAAMIALPAIAGAAGHVVPTGVTTEPASQLIAWYDDSGDSGNDIDGFSFFQVTNLSADTGVNIHIQFFADDVGDDTDRCREHNFTDSLTPTDTVLYCLDQLDGNGNAFIECSGNNAGSPVAIDLRDTRGFVVVTAVNQVTLPRRAISHNYLVGTLTTFINFDTTQDSFAFNAMGRLAVDFTTGALAPAGVLLDGVTVGLAVLQPDFLFFGFNDAINDEDANIISIAFGDTYSDPNGEYRAESATAVWDPLYFDQSENATSCQQHINTCFVTVGLDDDLDNDIDEGDADYGDTRLCPASGVDGTGGGFDSLWVNIAVSGLSGLQNNVGIVMYDNDDGSNMADWMHAN